jgi:hypothetical protein
MVPGERVAVVITDGSLRRAMLGHVATALADLAGEEPDAPAAHRRWPAITRAAMGEAARRMGGALVSMRQVQPDLKHPIWYGWALLAAPTHP